MFYIRMRVGLSVIIYNIRKVMSKICTDLEQSRKLVKMKLDKNTADMHYFSDGYNPTKLDVGYSAENAKFYRGTECEYTPAWSLTALLDLMPQRIYTKTGKQEFGIDKGEIDVWYQIFYENKNSYIQQKAEDAVDAAFEMIVWLLENKYIK